METHNQSSVTDDLMLGGLIMVIFRHVSILCLYHQYWNQVNSHMNMESRYVYWNRFIECLTGLDFLIDAWLQSLVARVQLLFGP